MHIDDLDAIEAERIECNAFEETFYTATSRADSLSRGICFDQIATSVDSGNFQQTIVNDLINPGPISPAGASALGLLGQQNIRLPKINLPSFSGVHADWLEFRDKYLSLIHNNASISDIQKFHYLRASLEGDASLTLQGTNLTSENYLSAWQLVCSRYNNPRVLLNNHLKAFVNMEPLNHESASKLRFLLDNLSKHVNALNAINTGNSNLFDCLVIFLTSTKLDSVTARDWEEKLENNKLPTLSEFTSFLHSKCNLLSTIELSRSGSNTHTKSTRFVNTNQMPYRLKTNSSEITRTYSSFSCPICKHEHYLRNCPEFLKLSSAQRKDKIINLRRCINCLRYGHMANSCEASNCRVCNGKHHSLLHPDKTSNVQSLQSMSMSNENAASALSVTAADNNVVSVPSCGVSSKIPIVLLSTAIVVVYDKDNNAHNARVLLDSGSEANFITKDFATKIGADATNLHAIISGIAKSQTHINSKCCISYGARDSSFKSFADCLIIPNQITGNIPSLYVNKRKLHIPSNYFLADPSFCVPAPVDILLGADHFYKLLLIGQHKINSTGVILQKTRLGWIVSGRVDHNQDHRSSFHGFLSNASVCADDALLRFWEIEEISRSEPFSSEEQYCEEHFIKTTKRTVDCRFIVNIPTRHLSRLGASFEHAKMRFLNLERKLIANPELRTKYAAFMHEYLSLQHMSEVNSVPIDKPHFYLPHHAVLNDRSSTTKLRVVFDGSAKSSSGMSINDCCMLGPVLQNDLFSILLRFRTYRYVATADVEKMYRQVLIDPEQRNLQLILWRFNESSTLQSYQLNTVTYGTVSASYLAIRTLHELANEFEQDDEMTAHRIKRDFYVDDLITGSNSFFELQSLCKNINSALQRGGFVLRKWTSNESNLFSKSENPILDISQHDNSKTLGLLWNSREDTFLFKINEFSLNSKVTKRSILSSISQLFDPLGLLAPTVILAKILIQQLWAARIDWDETVPPTIHTKWCKFRNSLSALNTLRIKRHCIQEDAVITELHGFSDASEKAYGAAIYVRSINSNGEIKCSLFTAKSKVAPLKQLTIPRLELCGALLLSKLVAKVVSESEYKFDRITLWTDSTIVLCWLKTPLNTLKQFVSNRVGEIISHIDHSEWRYVPTADNPADLLSRGLYPPEILRCNLWWQGPKWLLLAPSNWPESIFNVPALPELKLNVCMTTTFIPDKQLITFERFSSLRKIENILVNVNRFISKCRRASVSVLDPTVGQERERAHIIILKAIQFESFKPEINALTADLQISKKSSLIALAPFLDNNGVLRVGGRLQNSSCSYDNMHQIILPKSCHVTKLIFTRYHLDNFHVGPQGLLSAVRAKYWPIAGRCLARQIYRQCVTCFRASPTAVTPQMGQLPSFRVKPSPTFFHCGTDYAGPFTLKASHLRGAKTYKAWIVIFICMGTKACHVELVTSLTTEGFILALRRFVARRGKPGHLYSDNGTNYIGANRVLKELYNFIDENSSKISIEAEREAISWHFIPARSPHFGGIWEAGVRSIKYHLSRVTNNFNFTFEEFYTLIVQVEAILNSRPLTTLSSDPNDFNPLTPAHFLVFRPLTSIPEQDFSHLSISRLNRYQHLMMMVQHLWARWSKEYLHELQTRTKWRTDADERRIKLDAIVFMVDDNQPSIRWKLGRIVELHPGKDGKTRAVSLRTGDGSILRRAVAKLCPLPIDDLEDANYEEINVGISTTQTARI